MLLPNLYFASSRFANVLGFIKAFLQYYRFVNLTIVFLDLDVLSGLWNLWHALIKLDSTGTSISASNDATVASNSLPATYSGISEQTNYSSFCIFQGFIRFSLIWLPSGHLMIWTRFANAYFHLAILWSQCILDAKIHPSECLHSSNMIYNVFD